MFSEDFVQFQSAPAQCNSWIDFVSNQLTSRNYSSVTLSGTFNTTGFTCSDPTVATQICGALHTGGIINGVFCSRRFWFVGQCGGAPELNLDGAVCSCTFGGADVRPCSGSSWGGVNTQSATRRARTLVLRVEQILQQTDAPCAWFA